MLTKEIVSLFRGNKTQAGDVDISDFARYQEYGDISLKLADNKMDYYYEISIYDLSKSHAPNDLIQELKDNGWILSKDCSHLVKLL